MENGTALEDRQAGVEEEAPPRKRRGTKRRVISTACIACRRRKSKCDGNLPACAACSSVYNTQCVYDPNSDHRRKGVYKKDDANKTRESTLETIVQAILNYPEEDVPGLVQQIRTCESLDAVAEAIVSKENGVDEEEEEVVSPLQAPVDAPAFETQLSGHMGKLSLEDGSTRYFGGTSNLVFVGASSDGIVSPSTDTYQQHDNPITSWTDVTSDQTLIMHLLNMYFTWHYAYFTTLSRSLFFRDFMLGKPAPNTRRTTEYCTPLLVNTMLALGCHFSSWPGARENPADSATAGDHFFREAKRLIMVNDEHEKPKMTTVVALALMSVREAGCGREVKGWVYSGMSFRMACDLGLNLDSGAQSIGRDHNLDEAEEDARRITFWGCFLFDKCWSNYLGRMPQLPLSIITVPKFDVFPNEEAEIWAAYTDSGFIQSHAQPSRTRALARRISSLCEISNDLMTSFYNPIDMDKPKGKQAELKKLSDIHQRLETWRRELPKELEPKEGGLPSMLVMHMFFQLLYIHLFRPFLKYNHATSPLPANVSPRRLCTHAASMISKLLRLYKRSHGLRQICNIAVYIAHSACTIHLLNLPDKNARRDIIHGVKHLEEIAEGWLCARRTLGILSVLAKQWNIELPEEASTILARTEARFGPYLSNLQSPPQPQPASPPSDLSPTQAVGQNGGPFPSYRQYMGTSLDEQRRVSNNSQPPSSAADMQQARAQRRPSQMSTNTTPGTSQPQRMSSDSATATAAGSPSDIFGGVDQLLRDSQDWWFKDQNQLAMGFENWNQMTSGLDTSGWLSMAPNPLNDLNYLQGIGNQAGAPATGGTPNSANNGIPGFDGLDGFGSANVYNEEEWYQ